MERNLPFEKNLKTQRTLRTAAEGAEKIGALADKKRRAVRRACEFRRTTLVLRN
jgi:hypothetical protein